MLHETTPFLAWMKSINRRQALLPLCHRAPLEIVTSHAKHLQVLRFVTHLGKVVAIGRRERCATASVPAGNANAPAEQIERIAVAYQVRLAAHGAHQA
ncbi:hypothetical protein [Pseudomonas sp.]|uniref:hypothetical protein n=1 Tax=Pseudomonas sp. TaxID=306 RepID=UPI0026349464|nr:hypothetical protein [Pseudomonas sp.]